MRRRSPSPLGLEPGSVDDTQGDSGSNVELFVELAKTVEDDTDLVRRSCTGPVHQIEATTESENTFTGNTGFPNSSRSRDPCKLLPEGPVEGIDSQQEKELKSRRKAVTDKPEPEKWVDIYRILFLGVKPSLIPSPYYEYKSMEHSHATGDQHAADCCSKTLSVYGQYLEKELPSCVRRKLEEDDLLDLDSPVPGLVGVIADLIRSLQPEMLRGFLESRKEAHRLPETCSVTQISTNALPIADQQGNARMHDPSTLLQPIDPSTLLQEINDLTSGVNSWSPGSDFPEEWFNGLPWDVADPLDDLLAREAGSRTEALSEKENLNTPRAAPRLSTATVPDLTSDIYDLDESSPQRSPLMEPILPSLEPSICPSLPLAESWANYLRRDSITDASAMELLDGSSSVDSDKGGVDWIDPSVLNSTRQDDMPVPVANDAPHQYWLWNENAMNHFHRDPDTGEVAWYPREFDSDI
ncbi:Uu.00g082550.m01.CDS01 [Anthostomella pinea]|uniref:Uu.00g082550.m01.CDS01 n=1 Tax=Anthostomella pinea TaxID=933095 RepID=A0AAI8VLE9_9PEZI|nr:Uu.00g082550.m01.CDS01 [Anthostomella pinea]